MPKQKLIYWIFILYSGLTIISTYSYAQKETSKPLRVAVSGITHGHVPWILGRKDKKDIELVGIYEPNKELVLRYAAKYKLNKDLFYNDLATMLDAVKPEAVVAFGSVLEHMAVVEAAAPRGIHVMVEKPLATNLAHASRMQELAKKFNIHILTNYETSWYPSIHKTYELVNDSNYVGNVNKVVVHAGHQGPKEIKVDQEFLDWLTDPVQNGGGALIDFGCYGASIMTWLMNGQMPVSVMAVTSQFKPAIYPIVDDDAIIIVSYPNAQCIIQASWNWPFNRKDIEVYGDKGFIITADDIRMKMKNQINQQELILNKNPGTSLPEADPFTYLADVIRAKVKVPEYGPYSLENNLIVVRILEAARESAKTGKSIYINQ